MTQVLNWRTVYEHSDWQRDMQKFIFIYKILNIIFLTNENSFKIRDWTWQTSHSHGSVVNWYNEGKGSLHCHILHFITTLPASQITTSNLYYHASDRRAH